MTEPGPNSRLAEHWPLFDLRVVTPRLEIRMPRDDDLGGLLSEIQAGVHDPATMPFTQAFTDVPSPRRERESLQWWWRQRAEWAPESWNYCGAVFLDGEPIGVQDLIGRDFATLRTVSTGSWIGLRHQGRGIGKEMREAVLHLAFAGLGAIEAHSGAWHDNARSMGVSRSLGYLPNGEKFGLRRAERDRMLMLRLPRNIWELHRRDDIQIVGLEPCLDFFGAA